MQLPAHMFAGTLNAAEPMQVDVPPEENENVEEDTAYIVENTTLDLESYAQNYVGLAKIYRLLYVADHCPSLRVDALKLILAYVQTTYNVPMYQDVYKRLQDSVNGPTGPTSVNALPDIANQEGGIFIPPFDTQWVEAKRKKALLKLEKLDTDLKNYKSNSIKESIRRGHDDLGDHYLDMGNKYLSDALKCYSRARDYCTTSKHIINMCLNVIKVSVYLYNWSHVISYVNKAEATPELAEVTTADGKESHAAVLTKLACAAGLAELAMKKYKPAAKHFLLCNLDRTDFPELISANNVAVYGGLTALASFTRQELQKHVISSSSFKLFLELEPQLRDVIFQFYNSKYASCLKMLDDMKDNLLLDMYLAPHVNMLYTQIRNRALIQYFSPYVSANMDKMADAFITSVPALEDELVNLILDGQIQARIDSYNKILYAKAVDQRSHTFEKALQMGSQYQRRTKALILRAAMIKNNIVVCSPPRDNQSETPSNSTSSTPRN